MPSKLAHKTAKNLNRALIVVKLDRRYCRPKSGSISVDGDCPEELMERLSEWIKDYIADCGKPYEEDD